MTLLLMVMVQASESNLTDILGLDLMAAAMDIRFGVFGSSLR